MSLNLRKTSWQFGQLDGEIVSLETQRNPTAQVDLKADKAAISVPGRIILQEPGAGAEESSSSLTFYSITEFGELMQQTGEGMHKAATFPPSYRCLGFYSILAPALVFSSDH